MVKNNYTVGKIHNVFFTWLDIIGVQVVSRVEQEIRMNMTGALNITMDLRQKAKNVHATKDAQMAEFRLMMLAPAHVFMGVDVVT